MTISHRSRGSFSDWNSICENLENIHLDYNFYDKVLYFPMLCRLIWEEDKPDMSDYSIQIEYNEVMKGKYHENRNSRWNHDFTRSDKVLPIKLDEDDIRKLRNEDRMSILWRLEEIKQSIIIDTYLIWNFIEAWTYCYESILPIHLIKSYPYRNSILSHYNLDPDRIEIINISEVIVIWNTKLNKYELANRYPEYISLVQFDSLKGAIIYVYDELIKIHEYWVHNTSGLEKCNEMRYLNIVKWVRELMNEKL